MITTPLVSCIMPTTDRPTFVPLAVDLFLRQDFPDRELVIVDDGREPIADLVPDDARIRYQRIERRLPLGTKRNLACEMSSGEVIVHWDDDDWYPADRISVQVEALWRSGADMAGCNSVLFFDPAAGAAWRYRYPERRSRPLVAGSSLCYTRAGWERNRFDGVTIGEDNYFQRRCRNLLALQEERLIVALIHRANTSPRTVHGPSWQYVPEDDIVAIMGADAGRYRAAVRDAPRDVTTAYTHPSRR